MHDFDATLREHGQPGLRRRAVSTVQLNLGRRCNQRCVHCHVGASPEHTECMPPREIRRVLTLLETSPEVAEVDLTGGAPELCPGFAELVEGARRLGRQVKVRTNLTILTEEGQGHLGTFFQAHQVHLVGSLPCFLEENVDRQRGEGAFRRSIQALQELNQLGYPDPDRGLQLDLVHNPLGAALPPPQECLEQQYREALLREHGVRFSSLLTITNMPIQRFAGQLRREGTLESYLELLVHRFNPSTLDGLMCTGLVSVSWDGRLHDCDFNQALGIPVQGARRRLADLETLGNLLTVPITTGPHCFGCTAGAGSSCHGALV